MKLVVPSSGSMIHWYSALPSATPDSSASIAWSGYALRTISMIASSAAWSTLRDEVVHALGAHFEPPPSSAARLMIEPARRAARTAMLSMGCMGRVF